MTRSVPASRQSLTLPGFQNAAALAYKSSLLSKRSSDLSNALFSWLGEHYRVNDRHATCFVELDEFFPDHSAQAFGFGHASRGAWGHVSHRTAPSSRTFWAGLASNSLPLSASPPVWRVGLCAGDVRRAHPTGISRAPTGSLRRRPHRLPRSRKRRPSPDHWVRRWPLSRPRFCGPDRWHDDMLRQRVRERAGGTFWRCFAADFGQVAAISRPRPMASALPGNGGP